MSRQGLLFGSLIFVVAGAPAPVDAQSRDLAPTELKRSYPGSGVYTCPAMDRPAAPSHDDLARARQIASGAQQAFTLGALERAAALLAEAAALDGTSAEYAYRRARLLEDLERYEPAMVEYCRAIALGGDGLGPPSPAQRIDAIREKARRRLPARAEQAFMAGLSAVDRQRWTEAIDSFSVAVELAPKWSDPLYNRGLILQHVEEYEQALRDFRAYIVIITDVQTTVERQPY